MDDFDVLLLAHSPIGLVYSENRIIRRCNPCFARMFGYTPAELTDQSLAILYPSSEEFQRIGQMGAEVMASNGHYHDERVMQRKDGSHFWCRVRGQSLDPARPFARAVWSFADISDARPDTDLTMRERQVAKLMAEGMTSKEIARALGLSHRTVEAHRARLMEKFGAKNSLELVAQIAGLPL